MRKNDFVSSIEDQTKIKLIDSHAHLELEPLHAQVPAVISRAKDAGLIAIVTVGIDLKDAKEALKIAEQYDIVYAAIGFHPHNSKGVRDDDLAEMEELCKNPKVVGYGEIGLDFFRNLSPLDIQLRVFEDQIKLAKKIFKPIIVHLRDAYKRGLTILEKHAPYPAGGAIHCFSGNGQDAQRSVDLGFNISIPGTVTYKKNDELRSVVVNIPDKRVLIETDCPFLPPEPYRGKDNEPAYIVHTARKIAEIRGVEFATIAHLTSQNAIRLFNLPL